MKDFYISGWGSFIVWIVVIGWNFDVYLFLMEYEKDEGFDEKFFVYVIFFIMSKNNDKLVGVFEIDDLKNENMIKLKINNSNGMFFGFWEEVISIWKVWF